MDLMLPSTPTRRTGSSALFLCLLAYYVMGPMKQKLARKKIPRVPRVRVGLRPGSRPLRFPALMDHMALLSRDELKAKDGSKAKVVLLPPQALKLPGVRLK